MTTSALLKHGLKRAGEILQEMQAWMETFEYQSVQQMIGSMSQQAVAEPAAFGRANYMKALLTYDNRLIY